MSAQHLFTAESRTDRPAPGRATPTTPAGRPPTASAPYTFHHVDRRRLRNLIDECNAVLVDPTADDDA